VYLVDLQPRQPAQVRAVPVEGGRALRTLRITLDELPAHAERYGDDYLRVFVELERPQLSLFERVREFLPNALDVTAVLPQAEGGGIGERHDHRTISPDELFARYYASAHGGAHIPDELLALFRELHVEAEHAAA
jgi:hypothetical protein